MDWQIKPLSKKSSLSGADLSVGDEVVSFVYIGENSLIERIDILKNELDNTPLPQNVIGKWERKVSESPEQDEKFARKLALASSEDLFISLFDNESVDAPQKDIIKMLLALQLERKRILKSSAHPQNGIQTYIHTASKREFQVRQIDIDDNLIINIQSQLNSLII